jgi:hypothetical protein
MQVGTELAIYYLLLEKILYLRRKCSPLHSRDAAYANICRELIRRHFISYKPVSATESVLREASNRFGWYM